MAYDKVLEQRIDQFLNWKGIPFEGKKMMGGLAYMIDDKMCVGIVRDMFMARVGPDYYEEALQQHGVSPMNFTGKAMKGYVFVDPGAVSSDAELQKWIEKCLEFNPKARSSKKKKKSGK